MPCSTSYCFSIKDDVSYSPPAPPYQSPPSPSPSPSPSPPPPPLLPPPPKVVYFPNGELHRAAHHKIFKNLLISASLIGGFFLFAALVILLHDFYRKWKLARTRRRRNAQILDDGREDFLDENHGPVVDHPIWYIRTLGLRQAIIDSITVCKYRKDEGLIEGTECSVCLSEFEEDESLRLLPKCNHAFHLPCIDQWLRSHKNCPLCRAPIVREGHEGSSEGSSSNSDHIEDALAVDLGNQADELGDGHHHQPEERNSPELESLSIDEVPKVVLPNFYVRNGRSRIRSDLVDNLRVVEGDSEPMRRSVSMDSSSASKIYSAMVNIAKEDQEGSSSSVCHSAKFHKSNSSRRENSASSIYKMMRKNTISIKRTFPSSRRFDSARSSTSQSSILPL